MKHRPCSTALEHHLEDVHAQLDRLVPLVVELNRDLRREPQSSRRDYTINVSGDDCREALALTKRAGVSASNVARCSSGMPISVVA